METKLQVGVKALIKNLEGKYLVLKRNPEKYPEIEDLWDIPGGRIDPGIPLLENLSREIKEETSLELAGEPKLLAAQDILRIEGRHVIRLTYAAEAKGQVQIVGDEHSEYQWLGLEELKALDGLDKYLRELLETKTLL
ncbi:MAG: ADP-ribose pyrophosphatase [Parcubacteria group bacterium GW2011_GWA1_47_11]|uniref:Nudix hydrolase domain-containing protein n=1 Tax=Candidatus Colwellbacteria bacterium GWA2_46_10 TaxID=1797684 RepID=A0A1G1YUT5_9BACT|nr:MAG: ADP-ribose pyrophosphatase [Parcubacteria group bacterium GW2011_GWA2_46_10]KKU55983.1 MAG: ADP-ribose pyrophosphatase [Parcubacteria group bacterium GW2011_GWA1_47_11]OGY56125.1 MAG: hypothetical protein A2119_02865 [Candidatus Colwellbacteria bacterium GWA2_46_10]